MAEKLSPTQQKLMATLGGHRCLVRYPGGYWSAPGVTLRRVFGEDVPEWYFGTRTVEALLKKGELKSAEERGNSQGVFSVVVVRNDDLKVGQRVRFAYERRSLSIYYQQFLGHEGILAAPHQTGEWLVDFSDMDHLYLYPSQLEVVNE